MAQIARAVATIRRRIEPLIERLGKCVAALVIFNEHLLEFHSLIPYNLMLFKE